MRPNLTLEQPRRLAWLLGLGLGLAIAVSFAVKPVWREVKDRRAGKFLALASAARTKGDPGLVLAYLRAANSLAPHHPAVLRAVASHYSAHRHREGLYSWQLLEQGGHAHREDRLAHARLALSLAACGEASSVLHRLLAEAPEDAVVLALLADLATLEENLPAARDYAKEALNRDPDNAAHELKLGGLELADGGNPERVRTGRSRLLRLIVAEEGPSRATAARLLLANGLLDRPWERLLARLLADLPEQTSEERLVRYAAAVRSAPASRAEALSRLAGPLQPKRALPDLILTAEWLGELRDYDAILALIPDPRAMTDAALARLRLGALAGKKDWAAMDEFLLREDQPLPPVLYGIFHAGAVQMAGRIAEALPRWQLALGACGTDPDALELLARQAEAAGARGVALEAWQRMLTEPRMVSRATEQILRLASEVRDVKAMIVALKRLLPFHLDEPGLRLSLAFCQLMLNVEHDDASATLAAGAGAYPDQGLYQVTAALAALRDGHLDRAASELNNPAIRWDGSPESWRVVRVAVLGQTGQRTQARKIAAELDSSKLAAAELDLVHDWLPD